MDKLRQYITIIEHIKYIIIIEMKFLFNLLLFQYLY